MRDRMKAYTVSVLGHDAAIARETHGDGVVGSNAARKREAKHINICEITERDNEDRMSKENERRSQVAACLPREDPRLRTFSKHVVDDAKSTQRSARKRQNNVQVCRLAGQLISFCLNLPSSGDCGRAVAEIAGTLPTPGLWPSGPPFFARFAPALCPKAVLVRQFCRRP